MTIQEIKNQFQHRTPGIQDVSGEYAVLIPLVERADGLSLLFEVRAATMRRQPGEVCFPGGKMEEGETPEACALRETNEELGIPPSAIHVIAPLDKLVHQSGYLMHPILARVESWGVDGLRPNPAEVEESFQVPLRFFMECEPLCPTYALEPKVGDDFPYALIGFPGGYDWKAGEMAVPIYNWEGRAIWGITGRIIQHLTEELRQDV